MRDIHPAYPVSHITCACGAAYDTRTTRGSFTVDVCGACHPLYTGKQKLMDTAGRVDRFRKRFGDTKASNKNLELAAPAPEKPAKVEKAPPPKGKKK